MSGQSIRKWFEAALVGEPLEQPVYAVYDRFAQNRLHPDRQPFISGGNFRRIRQSVIRAILTIDRRGGSRELLKMIIA